MRKFTFGNNGVEFTHDVLIKYQTLTCGFNIHLLGIQNKPVSLRANSGLFLIFTFHVHLLQSPNMCIKVHYFFVLMRNAMTNTVYIFS